MKNDKKTPTIHINQNIENLIHTSFINMVTTFSMRQNLVSSHQRRWKERKNDSKMTQTNQLTD